MAIRAYGKSVVIYPVWQPLTAYSLGDIRIPTRADDVCYKVSHVEVIEGQSLSGATEPPWDSRIGATTKDGAIIWVSQEKEGAPAPLSVILDVEKAGGYSLKDIWVKSDSPENADFIVYGSFDKLCWRQIEELNVPHANRDNRHKGIHNAYPFIKVETEAVAVNEIEIVAEQS